MDTAAFLSSWQPLLRCADGPHDATDVLVIPKSCVCAVLKALTVCRFKEWYHADVSISSLEQHGTVHLTNECIRGRGACADGAGVGTHPTGAGAGDTPRGEAGDLVHAIAGRGRMDAESSIAGQSVGCPESGTIVCACQFVSECV